jgi:hypothetical protein
MFPLCSGTSLVLESATAAGFVGILAKNTWLKTTQLGLQPLESLVPTIKECVEETLNHEGFDSIESIVYAKGPGSTLSLRVTEMFLSTLQRLQPSIRLYPYNTLVLYALQLKSTDHHLLCPKPDHSWQVLSYQASSGTMLLEVMSASELEGLPYPLYHLPLRKKHPQLPAKAQALLSLVPSPSLFSEPLLYQIGLD